MLNQMLAGSWRETSGDVESACTGYRSIMKNILDLVDAQEKLDGLKECIPEE